MPSRQVQPMSALQPCLLLEGGALLLFRVLLVFSKLRNHRFLRPLGSEGKKEETVRPIHS